MQESFLSKKQQSALVSLRKKQGVGCIPSTLFPYLYNVSHGETSFPFQGDSSAKCAKGRASMTFVKHKRPC